MTSSSSSFAPAEPPSVLLIGGGMIDHLMVQLTGQPFLPVFEVSADRFEYDVVSAALIFQKDDAGKVTRLILQQNGTMAPAIRK